MAGYTTETILRASTPTYPTIKPNRFIITGLQQGELRWLTQQLSQYAGADISYDQCRATHSTRRMLKSWASSEASVVGDVSEGAWYDLELLQEVSPTWYFIWSSPIDIARWNPSGRDECPSMETLVNSLTSIYTQLERVLRLALRLKADVRHLSHATITSPAGLRKLAARIGIPATIPLTFEPPRLEGIRGTFALDNEVERMIRRFPATLPYVHAAMWESISF